MLMGVVDYSFSIYFTTLGELHASLVNVSIIGNTEPFFVYLYSLLFSSSNYARLCTFWGEEAGKIAPVLRSSERLGYMLTAENNDHTKSPKDLYQRV